MQAEPHGNESSEKLISVDELENQVILLPWYTSETDDVATLDPRYNGMNRLDSHVILLPWYPTEKKDIVESYLDYDGINDLGTKTNLLPLKSSQTDFRETSNSVYAEVTFYFTCHEHIILTIRFCTLNFSCHCNTIEAESHKF